MEENFFGENTEVQALAQKLQKVKENIGQLVFGQEEAIDLLLVGLLCNGHILLEGVPGIAKTLLAKLFAKSLHIDFARIQFTPDLMPSDVLGTSIFNPKTLDFEYRKGPVFSNFILIDEINRSPAKTQAALFELMEERQITMDGHTYHMAKPFMVVATQNPVEQEGTYRLPEAQMDRFMLKVLLSYPLPEDEERMLHHFMNKSLASEIELLSPVLDAAEVGALQEIVQQIKVEPALMHYIVELTQATRKHRHIQLGVSPRGALALMHAAKAFAALQERDFVIPDDIKAMSTSTWSHRMLLTPDAEIEGITTVAVLHELFDTIETPR